MSKLTSLGVNTPGMHARNSLASPAGVFRGDRISSLPREGRNTISLKTPRGRLVIPDLLNSSKYIACFCFKNTLLIPFDDTPDQNLEISLAGMSLRIICHGHCYRQLTVRQKSHRARITRVILLPISPRVGCVVLSLF